MRRQSNSLQGNLCQAQQRHLKTVALLSHQLIVFTDTIDYRTIVFLHYRPNPSKHLYTRDSTITQIQRSRRQLIISVHA